MHVNIHVFFFVIMGFIFPALTTAIRFFMAFAIFVYALPFLYKRSYMYFFFLCLVAYTFHRASVVLLLFLLGDFAQSCLHKLRIRNVFLRITIFVGIATMLYVLLLRRLPFQDLVLLILSNLNISPITIEAYFVSMTRFGWIILFMIYIVNLMLSIVLVRESRRFDCIPARILDINIMVNILSSLLLPLSVFNLVFYRLYFFQTVVNVILYSQIINAKYQEQEISVKRISKLDTLFLFLICAWMVPAFLGVNSISIGSMIASSMFANF